MSASTVEHVPVTVGDPVTASRPPWCPRPHLTAAAAFVVVAGAPWLPGLSGAGRVTVAVFGLATLAWVATRLDDTRVAVAGVAALLAVGVLDVGDVAGSFLDSTAWLLLAAFVVAAAVRTSGLATRLTIALAGRARSVRQLFALLTVALFVTAFVIPATSGRVALALPVFVGLATAIADRRVVRALALLFPSVILLSAATSLLGAGAHLVTGEVLERMTGEGISFGRWVVLGLPFAAVSCALACEVILRLFLTSEERRRPLQLDRADLVADAPTGPFGAAERRVLAVVVALVALWATEPVHGVEPAVVAVLGAVAVVAPRTGVLTPRAAAAAVKWELLVFLAATLLLGQALVSSGAAEWLMERALSLLGDTTPALVVVGAVATVSLLAHLLVTSRTARSTVLIPLVVVLAQSLGYPEATLAFVSTVGAGYCLTLPVSAKPVAMFRGLDTATYEPADLARLSSVLLPLHLLLLVGFTFTVWPALGLGVDRDSGPPDQRPTPAWEGAVSPPATRLAPIAVASPPAVGPVTAPGAPVPPPAAAPPPAAPAPVAPPVVAPAAAPVPGDPPPRSAAPAVELDDPVDVGEADDADDADDD